MRVIVFDPKAIVWSRERNPLSVRQQPFDCIQNSLLIKEILGSVMPRLLMREVDTSSGQTGWGGEGGHDRTEACDLSASIFRENRCP